MLDRSLMDPRSRRMPSAALDDGASIRSRAPYGSAHRLRPAESRYSLREQFAATRREYEFGFDDASSFLERSTLASEAVRGDEFDDTVVAGAETAVFSGGSRDYRDCYELLCLPREPSLTPDQVRHAAHRLVQVLSVDRQPPHLQGQAAFYLGLAQSAFETLVEPSRRLGYDLSGVDEPDADCDEAVVGDDGDDERLPCFQSSDSYESRLQEQYLRLTQRESRAATDLGMRIDAVPLLASQRDSRRHGSSLELLDFSLRKSATTSLPALRHVGEKIALFLDEFGPKLGGRVSRVKAGQSLLRLTDPTVTITGSAHGLLDEPFKLAPLLLGLYQPPGPSIHGPRRVEQLLASRFLPMLNLNLRQELFWRANESLGTAPDLVVEQELELLPLASTTTRIGHSVLLSGSDEPLNVELSVQKFLTRRSDLSPSLGLAVHQRVGSGTAFLVADGGDWNLRTSRECRELSKFAKVSGALAPVIDVFRNPPTVEVGYAFGRHDLGMQAGQAFTKPCDRGLTALDCDLDENKPNSWTVSTGLTPGNAAAYLRYGRDLLSSPTSTSSNRRKPGLRAEVELSGTTNRDSFLAFRVLKRIGRFSKAGLEVGLSPSNLHLSLYWSRLGQRISLPILLSAHRSRLATATSAKLLFWTTVFPFAALAAWQLYRRRRQGSSSASINKTSTGSSSSSSSSSSREKKIQAYIARRRAEADELTVILATGAEPRQAAERARGGLVILSAKYGARGAPPEEVADVTIAVAALVAPDDGAGVGAGVGAGRLVIPAGVRKSRLLGFWDPAPACVKVLRVRYLWEGREREVEAAGREELRLP